MGSEWTRRQFLQLVGSIGGSFAVHETMMAMGWMKMPEPFLGPPRLAPGSGIGKRVVILGAGIGALTSAYELVRAGYDVRLLEPTERAGGRSLTARRGTVITEQSEKHGVTKQTCEFDEGLYLNMGPGRLPYHHRRVLHYCNVLNVPLEVYVMTTTANLWQRDTAFNGNAMIRRRLATDAQGYISELLAKQVCKGNLNAELTLQERRQLLELLVSFGDLNGDGTSCELDPSKQVCADPKDYKYCGSTNAGCAELTIHQTCKAGPPIPLKTVLSSRFWNGAEGSFYQPLVFDWQPTLFQPVGGMDQIVEGFKRQIGSLISYRSEVTRIHLRPDGVDVEYRDTFNGTECRVSGDYCLSNIPLPILAKIPANFSPKFDAAVKATRFDPTCKVGWQANERFWENNQNQIYGGISYIDATITQIWYPSNGYFSGKGTLTGAYNYEQKAVDLGAMLPAERLRVARAQGKLLHPEIADDRIVPERLGLSIAWHNIPYQRGGWASWTSESPDHRDAYQRLLAPDGRFHVVGDQVSPLPGWQEGAMMSAEHVLEQIAGVRPTEEQRIQEAPDTRRLVLGRN